MYSLVGERILHDPDSTLLDQYTGELKLPQEMQDLPVHLFCYFCAGYLGYYQIHALSVESHLLFIPGD